MATVNTPGIELHQLISAARMAEDVKYLASLGPRYAATEREHKAAEYIEQKERRLYSLTEKGQMALLTVLAMACTLEKRVIPEEVEATFWVTRKEEKTKQAD